MYVAVVMNPNHTVDMKWMASSLSEVLIVFYVIIKISILPWYTCFLETVSTFFKRSAVYRSSRHRENLQSSNLVKYFCLWSLIFWLFVLPSYNTITNTETNTIVSGVTYIGSIHASCFMLTTTCMYWPYIDTNKMWIVNKYGKMWLSYIEF